MTTFPNKEETGIWVVEKATCYSVHRGNEVVGNFAGPDCAEHARMFAHALLASAAGGEPDGWQVQIQFSNGPKWSGCDRAEYEMHRDMGVPVRLLYTAPPPPVGELQGVTDSEATETLKLVCDALSIGTAARSRSTIMANVENARRRSDCLWAVEHGFFMVSEPDEDDPEGEPFETCLLRWGDNPEQYAKRFGEALAASHPVADKDAERMRFLAQRGGMLVISDDANNSFTVEVDGGTDSEGEPIVTSYTGVTLRIAIDMAMDATKAGGAS